MQFVQVFFYYRLPKLIFIFSRSRMVEKQYTLSKLHSNYGKLFSEWSVIEKEMGDGLQKAGHYFGNFLSIIFMLGQPLLTIQASSGHI